MYDIYIDGLLIPVAPAEILMNIANLNKTYNLVNGGEINIVKEDGLKTITMTVMLPSKKYPFSNYRLLFVPPVTFLEKFYDLKTKKKIFQLIVVRGDMFSASGFDTNMTVVLENYTVKENAEEGGDIVVDLTFKEYKEINKKSIIKIGSSKLNIGNTGSQRAYIKKHRPVRISLTDKTIKVDTNALVWQVCRKMYGSTDLLDPLMKQNKLKTLTEKLPAVMSYVTK